MSFQPINLAFMPGELLTLFFVFYVFFGSHSGFQDAEAMDIG